jgi:hypothetical protein
MTPRLWHKISKSIVTNKKRILASCFCSFLALMAINVIRSLGVNNDLFTLLSIVFAYIFFVTRRVRVVVLSSFHNSFSQTAGG